MRVALILPVLAGLAVAAPRPQEIDIAGVDAAPDPVMVQPAYDVVSQSATAVPTSPIQPITTNAVGLRKRRALMEKRDGNCALQPPGSGPTPVPDTPDAFRSFKKLMDMANDAPTPDGYQQVFVNQAGSLSASKYMGLTTIKSFDTLGCASLCDQAAGCVAFNMYAERDPSLDPNALTCPNPPSITNYKCTLWGAPVAPEQATNKGQFRDSFEVVIAASNAYNKIAPPPAITGFNGPTGLGGAINAPLDAQGHNTYMGYKYFPFSQSQGYTPSTCAAACTTQTAYNTRHPAADGQFMTCRFFNAYVLSQNGIPQGLYCSLYTQTWDPSYGKNYGQTRGANRYTVSQSYSYSLI